ncbi:hypothetical protein DESPIG_02240 [Desulfovibrio piger ATCC 29098]|uniref:Uncharacterized protein n=1 Tax=Desulfovibrio piger ATCC 29098 TaxID=411464 RepID=B6WVX2_9BACT|nr:hypothetical protein DESPIG_02240 [Desulfovibrio piger ATCC 29098]
MRKRKACLVLETNRVKKDVLLQGKEGKRKKFFPLLSQDGLLQS